MTPLHDALRDLFISIGENPDREGLQRTPERFERAFRELTTGYTQTPADITAGALFKAESHGLVLVKDIAFASLCEHHLLPFVGRAHVGYLPDAQVIGLSKIPRIVELCAQRLQTQERLGRQICDALCELLKPRGVGVILEAEHLCMTARGVLKERARIVTRHAAGEERESIWQQFPHSPCVQCNNVSM